MRLRRKKVREVLKKFQDTKLSKNGFRLLQGIINSNFSLREQEKVA